MILRVYVSYKTNIKGIVKKIGVVKLYIRADKYDEQFIYLIPVWPMYMTWINCLNLTCTSVSVYKLRPPHHHIHHRHLRETHSYGRTGLCPMGNGSPQTVWPFRNWESSRWKTRSGHTIPIWNWTPSLNPGFSPWLQTLVTFTYSVSMLSTTTRTPSCSYTTPWFGRSPRTAGMMPVVVILRRLCPSKKSLPHPKLHNLCTWRRD